MAAPLLYKRRRRLENHHNGSITSISFSPSGLVLASASLDGALCFWSVATGQLLCILNSSSSFLTMVWSGNSLVMAGMDSGVLLSVKMTAFDITATGFAMHNHPLECVDISANKIATGAQSEVSVWSFHHDHCVLHQQLPPPPTIGLNRHSPVVVTAVFWAPTHAENALLVAYMDHGVVIWDGLEGTMLQSMSFKTSVGRASLSPNERWLAVSNLATGFEIYDLSSTAAPRKLDHESGLSASKLRLPVLFAHGGRAVLGGSSFGDVGIWDAESEQIIHSLPHPCKSPVGSLAAYYDHDKDDFYVATGTAIPGNGNHIQIWQAQPVSTGHSSDYQALFVPLSVKETRKRHAQDSISGSY